MLWLQEQVPFVARFSNSQYCTCGFETGLTNALSQLHTLVHNTIGQLIVSLRVSDPVPVVALGMISRWLPFP
jgi:hypothetical protein